jgi:hypothetical protein
MNKISSTFRKIMVESNKFDNIYLVGNVVREPIKTLVQSLTRRGTCALNVPKMLKTIQASDT